MEISTMSARRILGLEKSSSLPDGNVRVINKLKTVKAHLDCSHNVRYNLSMDKKAANAVGKDVSEVDRAYLAGFLDADGAIMATIEPHREKRFRFRVWITVMVLQKFLTQFKVGVIRQNRTTYDWISRNQVDIRRLLQEILPFLYIKNQQAVIALNMLACPIESREQLLQVAQSADALSRLNVRSKNRRKNFMAMIQDSFSPND